MGGRGGERKKKKKKKMELQICNWDTYFMSTIHIINERSHEISTMFVMLILY